MRGFLDAEEPADGEGDFGALDAREVEITGTLTGAKSKVAFEFNAGTRTLWVPFAQLRRQQQGAREVVTITLPEWWAKKNRLI